VYLQQCIGVDRLTVVENVSKGAMLLNKHG